MAKNKKLHVIPFGVELKVNGILDNTVPVNSA